MKETISYPTVKKRFVLDAQVYLFIIKYGST